MRAGVATVVLMWSLLVGGDAFVTPCLRLHSCEISQPKHQGYKRAVTMSTQESSLSVAAASLGLAAILLVGNPALKPPDAVAISGGGLDYSGQNLTGKDFSQGKYKSKDFSGVIASGVSFKGSDLRGVRFFKADLKLADFTDANLGTASMEGADLEGAIFKNTVATGSYFSEGVGKVGDISGADFTEALIRQDIQETLCKRLDAKGTNSVTGVETRDSLLCDMF
ncbi:unnamed protein product [Discosporangium mesarthrocarpum]